MKAVLIVLLAAAALPSAAAPAHWIAASDYGNVYIVAAPRASAIDEKAIAEFQTYWKSTTAQDIAIHPKTDVGIPVYIGKTSIPDKYASNIDWDALQWDGVYLKSYGKKRDAQRALVIAGGSNRGAIYAVYEFFERYFGVRWLAPSVTHIPPVPDALPEVEYQYTPPFSHREIGLPAKANADVYRIGSRFTYGMNGHSLYYLLPPEEYFKDHPEYYSEINGKRIAALGFDWHNPMEAGNHPKEVGQLCMSNPEVAKALAHAICERIKKNPQANLWSVCQMDWGNNCQCPQCKAIDEREGCPMGSFLTGVNRVAELVEKEYPGTYIQTYAYTYTRKPPKTIKPRHNVVVQLCSFECDFARAFDDPTSPINSAFMRDYKTWSKLTSNLLLHDYPIDYSRYLLPHPNLHVFGPDIAAIARAHSLGLFELNVGGGETHEFGFLKPYLLSKLMWNPYANADAIRDEFIDLYYGKAAPFIKEYITLMTDTFRAKGLELGIYDVGGWIDTDFVEKADAIFQHALAAAESPEIRRRVDIDYLQVQFAALTSRPTMTYSADTLTITRPPSLTPQEMVDRMRSFGIKEFAELRPLDYLLTQFGGPSAARTLTTPIINLENECYQICIAPELEGSVLRWHDKRTGRELLRGYETYGAYAGTWQDWVDRNTQSEMPVAKTYSIVEKTPTRAIIEAKTENGAVVRREMSLTPGSDRLGVVLTVTNPTDKPMRAKVKIHPEFFSQKANIIPEIWFDEAGQWKRHNVGPDYKTPIGAGFEQPGTARRWAFYVPEAKLTLVNEFDPKQIDRILWYYNTTSLAQQMNLELMPPDTDLQPGETRTIQTQYYLTTKKPKSL